jgi:glutamate dehydrogenase
VPADLAAKVATLEFAVASLDLVEVAHEESANVGTVAQVYYTLDSQLNYAWLRQQIFKLSTDTHWQTLARGALRDDLAWRQRNLTSAVLKQAQANEPVETMLQHWEQANSVNVQRARKVLNDLKALGQADLAMLSVVLREMRI